MAPVLALMGQALLPYFVPTPIAADPCAVFDTPSTTSAGNVTRTITSLDQSTLADIGRFDTYSQPPAFGVSPDGRTIAFLVRRGNPQTNGICQRLMVMPADGSASPHEIDRGGELIRDYLPYEGITAVGQGWGKIIRPLWSPDGTTIAFLKRVNGRTQVWVAAAAGNVPARRVTDLPDNVEDLAWDMSGTAVIAATRPAIREKSKALAREALSGYLFDDRYVPHFGTTPLVTGPAPMVYSRTAIADGTTRDATPTEAAHLAKPAPDQPATALAFAKASSGAAIWTEADDPSLMIPKTHLVLKRPDGSTIACSEDLCRSTQGLWWSDDGRTAYIQQRAGWGKSQSRLLRWRIGDARPSPVFASDDAILGCGMVGATLVCGRETATQPRRLVAIDPETGSSRTLYDPNPQFTDLRLGPVQRFRFRNASGIECYSDLILPPDHKPGEKHPLVIVGYYHWGFMRGGTGDQFPIQVLAAHGFAVLAFTKPEFLPKMLQARTNDEMLRAGHQGWADRRSNDSALEKAIALTIATGEIDPTRIGITGFSDGISSAQWALVHDPRFKAASLSACCEDLYSYPLEGGPVFKRSMEASGYRWFEPGATAWWKPISLLLNMDRIAAPILVQAADTEYQTGLDVRDAFVRRNKPFELYVFADETHVRWQPAHRLAMYERSVDWFDFWLQHHLDCSPGKAAQYTRWKAMKGAPKASELTCKAPSPVP
jgi:dipeptidyl aminopeptidase/acylaminoacyl peptidase